MRLTRLHLQRSPGIRIPFTLEPTDGVNLVTGPNGVGKSSLCRAVFALLWPNAHSEKPFEAAAEFQVENRTLRVERHDEDSPRWSGAHPDLGPDHLAVRYRLGVLDLLDPTPQEDPLAREIRRHMSGGFDLEAVRARFFGFKAGQAESREWKNARELVAEHQTHQRHLATEQGNLAELKQERDLARLSRDRLTILKKLQELAERKTGLADAAARLEDLPPGVRHIRDEDPVRLEELRRRENELARRVDQLTAAVATAEKKIAAANPAGKETGDLPLDLPKKKLRVLAQIRAEVRQAERDAGDVRLAGILREEPRRRSVLPYILTAAGGMVLLAAGLFFFTSGAPQPLLLITGGGLAAMGLADLVKRPRDAGHQAMIREKRMELAARKDRLDACLQQQEEALAAFNATVEPAGIPPVDGPEEAEQLLEDLGNQRQRIRDLHGARDRDRELLDRDRKDLANIRTEIGALLGRVKLADGPDSDPRVRDLLDHRPAFDQATRDRDHAARDIARLEKEIAAGGTWLKDGEIQDIPPEKLVSLVEQETALADRYDDLQKEITTIETRIADAMAGHDLEQAEAEADTARSQLDAVRLANRRAALGRLLLDRVADQHEQQSRPAALNQAMEYFRLFTGHRYELKMAARDPECFVALDGDSGRQLELEELSDGTRMQLLLAVKLAFITAGEQGARPPVFLDDSLASADPERFAAVAVGLGRLAAGQERQIFYLTPDPAEAAAFQRALAGAGLPAAHHIDLAAVRNFAGAADPALLDPANLPARVMAPDPTGMTAERYAAALGVPRPDPWDRPRALHLLFLLDDDLDLVRRLVDGGAPTAGRFHRARETLLATGLITPDQADLVTARIKVWEGWLEGWRIGRAQPVTREFLAASSAVSGTYLDRVDAALIECGGDGGCLLTALAAGRVKGFRGTKRDQLHRELEEAELLDPREVWTDDQLIVHTLERVAPLVKAGILDMRKVKTLALTFARMAGSGNPA